MGALKDETMIDVLTGLTNCLVHNFVKLFFFLLLQAKLKSLNADTHESKKCEQLRTIMNNAVSAYHSLCTTSKCYVNNKASVHFDVIFWNYKKE